VATTPPGVSVYFVLETRTSWAEHLTSHARLEPEPAR
jgi:hypothetical protein